MGGPLRVDGRHLEARGRSAKTLPEPRFSCYKVDHSTQWRAASALTEVEKFCTTPRAVPYTSRNFGKIYTLAL